MALLNEIWGFLKVRKIWWLTPLIIIIFIGILIILGQGKNLPFVYNWTNGSISVSNEAIDEIFSVVQKGTKVVIK